MISAWTSNEHDVGGPPLARCPGKHIPRFLNLPRWRANTLRHILPDRLVSRSVLVAALADAVYELPGDPEKEQRDAE